LIPEFPKESWRRAKKEKKMGEAQGEPGELAT